MTALWIFISVILLIKIHLKDETYSISTRDWIRKVFHILKTWRLNMDWIFTCNLPWPLSLIMITMAIWTCILRLTKLLLETTRLFFGRDMKETQCPAGEGCFGMIWMPF